jgi:phenylpropionate dioxygenase-like ring-hydroxylating dioxygenase large terminal subunit
VTTVAENERMTRVEGAAPLGRLMRENYWIPFALSQNLVPGDAPTAVRLFGENYVAFRAGDGRIGFLDELCPHRRGSLTLARVEGNGLRCIYHGWKMDVSGRVVECPTQLTRTEPFMASVRLAHFAVREVGGIAWVWLGSAEPPAFPDLPFSAEHGVHTALTFSVLPCNWLQGLEGGLDSVHGTILHQSWIGEVIRRQTGSMDTGHAELALASAPLYETEATPYGLRAASLRRAGDGRTYIRVAHFFFPLVVVVPTGWPDHTQIFAFAPVDDTHHLLFFGNYGETPQKSQKDFGALRADLEPDARNFAALQGDRSNRWGQDRGLMKAGHFTGFGRSIIEEDAAVQVSMGPIADRSRENLSSSDVAVAAARRMILDAIASAEAGRLPPGSARAAELARVPDPFDAILEAGASWREQPARAGTGRSRSP